jgi:hypothetical protein
MMDYCIVITIILQYEQNSIKGQQSAISENEIYSYLAIYLESQVSIVCMAVEAISKMLKTKRISD